MWFIDTGFFFPKYLLYDIKCCLFSFSKNLPRVGFEPVSVNIALSILYNASMIESIGYLLFWKNLPKIGFELVSLNITNLHWNCGYITKGRGSRIAKGGPGGSMATGTRIRVSFCWHSRDLIRVRSPCWNPIRSPFLNRSRLPFLSLSSFCFLYLVNISIFYDFVSHFSIIRFDSHYRHIFPFFLLTI